MIAVKAAEEVQKGHEAVAEAVLTMKTIAKKISAIEELSTQTHMLSLNATIGAAEAEQHGKGFVVVASKVWALARRSHDSAEEMTVLIDSGVTIAELAGDLLHKYYGYRYPGWIV
ncbi:hypothetical protein CSA56_17225 [candidate division KSB3 bacterium]|uniref:Methyl-accepting transducer domain-containing protein n=1 Tax=candidate division KSB3 bacterium TaxID=2044937 RepID=A0A2G6K824_9BACT|nr:MAG: hypothetical protein CSA56_17225 [candidate division KSB3 bacterium]